MNEIDCNSPVDISLYCLRYDIVVLATSLNAILQEIIYRAMRLSSLTVNKAIVRFATYDVRIMNVNGTRLIDIVYLICETALCLVINNRRSNNTRS